MSLEASPPHSIWYQKTLGCEAQRSQGSCACFFITEANTVAGLVEDSPTLTKLAGLATDTLTWVSKARSSTWPIPTPGSSKLQVLCFYLLQN